MLYGKIAVCLAAFLIGQAVSSPLSIIEPINDPVVKEPNRIKPTSNALSFPGSLMEPIKKNRTPSTDVDMLSLIRDYITKVEEHLVKSGSSDKPSYANLMDMFDFIPAEAAKRAEKNKGNQISNETSKYTSIMEMIPIVRDTMKILGDSMMTKNVSEAVPKRTSVMEMFPFVPAETAKKVENTTEKDSSVNKTKNKSMMEIFSILQDMTKTMNEYVQKARNVSGGSPKQSSMAKTNSTKVGEQASPKEQIKKEDSQKALPKQAEKLPEVTSTTKPDPAREDSIDVFMKKVSQHVLKPVRNFFVDTTSNVSGFVDEILKNVAKSTGNVIGQFLSKL